MAIPPASIKSLSTTLTRITTTCVAGGTTRPLLTVKVSERPQLKARDEQGSWRSSQCEEVERCLPIAFETYITALDGGDPSVDMLSKSELMKALHLL